MDLQNIRQSLNTKWWGKELLFIPSAASTNIDAAVLGHEGVPTGFTILADTQTAGRGRFGRSWFSPPGENLYFSTVISATKKNFEISLVTLVAAVGVHDGLRRLFPSLKIDIKWPNDLHVERKKIAGILTEFHPLNPQQSYLVLGIGLNVNSHSFPKELTQRASSLSLLNEKRVLQREQIFVGLCQSLEEWYERWINEGFDSIRSYWATNSNMLGEQVKLSDPEGRLGAVRGLSNTGGLLVELQNGSIEEIKSGEVQWASD